jgi:hypothetical protein
MTTTGTIPLLPLHGHAGERSSGPAQISREEDQAGGTRETEEGEGKATDSSIAESNTRLSDGHGTHG